MRYVAGINLSCTYERVQPGLGTVPEDSEVPAQERLSGGQDIHQAGPGSELEEVPQEAQEYVACILRCIYS